MENNIDKHKSIQKDFFFSRKRLPVALALSNSVFIHLFGCNAMQSKNQAMSLSLNTYKAYSFDDKKEIDRLVNYDIKKLDAKSKEDILSPLYDSFAKMSKILHSRKSKGLKNNNEFLNLNLNPLFIYKKVNRLTSESINYVYKILHKATQKSITLNNIDDLYKVFNKAAQKCTSQKSLSNIDDIGKMLSKILKIDWLNTNSKRPKTLLTDLKNLTEIGLNKENLSNFDDPDLAIIFLRQFRSILNSMHTLLSLQEKENLKMEEISSVYMATITGLYNLNNTLYQEVSGYLCEDIKIKNLKEVVEDLIAEWPKNSDKDVTANNKDNEFNRFKRRSSDSNFRLFPCNKKRKYEIMSAL